MRKVLIVCSAIGVLVFSVLQAQALSVRLVSGAASFTCADGGGCDNDPTAGIVSMISNLGGVLVSSTTTGLSDPAIGSKASPDMDLSVVTTFGSNKSVHVFVSDVNFLGGTSGFTFAIGGTNPRQNDSVAANFYLDSTNALFGTGTLIGQLGPFVDPVAGIQHFGANGSYAGGANGPHSLTIDALITHALGGSNRATSFDAEIAGIAAPEPSSLFLLGTGLVLVGRRIRRR